MFPEFEALLRLYPAIGLEFDKIMASESINKLSNQNFRTLKTRIILVQTMLDVADGLDDASRKKCIDAILTEGDLKNLQSYLKEPSKPNPVWKKIWSYISHSESTKENIVSSAKERMKGIDDPSFLASLDDLSRQEPALADAISSVMKSAQTNLTNVVQRSFDSLVKVVYATQQKKLQEGVEQQCAAEEMKLLRESTEILIELIQSKLDPDSPYVLIYFDATR